MEQTYARVAADYRRNDERDADGPDHQRLARILSRICCSFKRPITALDLGCGTGRYFHALRNVRTLVGMDISAEMLEEARRPVCATEVTVENIQLVQGNFYAMEFPARSFDFIYSLGVFGNGCGVTMDLCRRFARWLKPDGKVFFDVIDATGFPLKARWRMQAKAMVYQRLPENLRQKWDQRSGWMPFFVTSPQRLRTLLRRSHFRSIHLHTQPSQLPAGPGSKIECMGSLLEGERFSEHSLVHG
jgi:ubiquinone/menaquinone biosynthesis C-methylase UbiE